MKKSFSNYFPKRENEIYLEGHAAEVGGWTSDNSSHQRVEFGFLALINWNTVPLLTRGNKLTEDGSDESSENLHFFKTSYTLSQL